MQQSIFEKISGKLTFKMSECGLDVCSCSDDEFGSDTDFDGFSPTKLNLELINENDEREDSKSHNGVCSEAISSHNMEMINMI